MGKTYKIDPETLTETQKTKSASQNFRKVISRMKNAARRKKKRKDEGWDEL